MNEMIRIWFKNLYQDAINESKETIKNEKIWESCYNGEDPNPHAEHIEMLREYIKALEEKLKELKV